MKSSLLSHQLANHKMMLVSRLDSSLESLRKCWTQPFAQSTIRKVFRGGDIRSYSITTGTLSLWEQLWLTIETTSLTLKLKLCRNRLMKITHLSTQTGIICSIESTELIFISMLRKHRNMKKSNSDYLTCLSRYITQCCICILV